MRHSESYFIATMQTVCSIVFHDPHSIEPRIPPQLLKGGTERVGPVMWEPKSSQKERENDCSHESMIMCRCIQFMRLIMSRMATISLMSVNRRES